MLDFIRIATAVPPVAVGDAVKNAEDICRYIASADEAGCDVVVFPECPEDYNGIVQRFQEGFADIARLYYKRTGKELQMVPMYIAPKLKKVCFGQPIRYCAANPKEEERSRLRQALMDAVTELAVAQPPHTVVPYNNISKRLYPTNVPREVPEPNEKAGC